MDGHLGALSAGGLAALDVSNPLAFLRKQIRADSRERVTPRLWNATGSPVGNGRHLQIAYTCNLCRPSHCIDDLIVVHAQIVRHA
jgi:hypothetical protein